MNAAHHAGNDLAHPVLGTVRFFRSVRIIVVAIVLAAAAYSLGMTTGFVADDYGWIRHAVNAELGWDVSFRVTNHSNGTWAYARQADSTYRQLTT